jgi:hypothetical protein
MGIRWEQGSDRRIRSVWPVPDGAIVVSWFSAGSGSKSSARASRAEWLRRLRQRERSGKAAAAFSVDIGMNPKTLA